MELRVVTFNLGNAIVRNVVEGSEAPTVQRCQREYAARGGWNAAGEIGQCTENAIAWLGSGSLGPFDLIGLQELPREKALNVLTPLVSQPPDKLGSTAHDRKAFGVWRNMDVYLLARKDILGDGIQVTPEGFGFALTGNDRGVHHTSAPTVSDLGRAYLGVWFPATRTFVAVVHAPHRETPDDLFAELEVVNRDLERVFRRDYPKARIEHVVLMGDFNAEIGDRIPLLLGKRLQSAEIRVNSVTDVSAAKAGKAAKATKTCCWPDYRWQSDLIFSSCPVVSHSVQLPSFMTDRPMSDHLPATANVLFK